MRTPLCLRTVSACIACVTAVTVAFDVLMLAISTSLRILAPVVGLNVLMAVAAAAALWHTRGRPQLAQAERLPAESAVVQTDARIHRHSPPPETPWWQCLAVCLPMPPPVDEPPAVGRAAADLQLHPAHHLLPRLHTAALDAELRDGASLGLRCALLRIRTTGEPVTEVSLEATLAFCDAALGRGAPFVFLLDCSETGRFVPPSLTCLRMILRWADANAKAWDTLGMAIGIVMTSDVCRPLLQLATRIMKPPQPISYARDEARALAFLVEQSVREAGVGSRG